MVNFALMSSTGYGLLASLLQRATVEGVASLPFSLWIKKR